MPPKGKLSDREIQALEHWVKLGVPWAGTQTPPGADGHFTITEKQRQFWAFQPIKAVPVPAIHDKDWAKSDVDHFVLAALEAKTLAPAGRRNQTVVATQALFFLNDPLVTAQAKALAARVAREAPASDEARIRRLYVLALGRLPSQAEIDVGLKLLAPEEGANPWERYCHTILCTNEFLYVD